jgi:hypothetical protein
VQKEKRIIATLEPVMNQHRLIVAEEVIRNEKEHDPPRQLLYQLSRLTSDRNSLRHDDRVDALAGAVAYWTERMRVDQVSAEDEFHDEKLRKELDEFMEAAIGRPILGPVYARINGRAAP